MVEIFLLFFGNCCIPYTDRVPEIISKNLFLLIFSKLSTPTGNFKVSAIYTSTMLAHGNLSFML